MAGPVGVAGWRWRSEGVVDVTRPGPRMLERDAELVYLGSRLRDARERRGAGRAGHDGRVRPRAAGWRGETLLGRHPDLRLAVSRDDLAWTHGDGLVLRGLRSLPVVLGPVRHR
jgi:hypothetical protein